MGIDVTSVGDEAAEKCIALALDAAERGEWASAAKAIAAIRFPVKERNHLLADAALLASVTRRMLDLDGYRNRLEIHHRARQARSKCKPRIAIYSAIIGNYDSLKIPEWVDPAFDYILFTDQPQPGNGLWDIRPNPILHCSDARASRYVKMHPHLLLPEYDLAIWIDANVMILDDIKPLIDDFLASNDSVGAVRHPHRNHIYEEIHACIRLRKEYSAPMQEQLRRYASQGFGHDDLIEANFLMFKLSDPRAVRFLDVWWTELETGSKRDQLCINYALRKVGIEWHRIMDRPFSIRTHPSFAYVEHDRGDNLAQGLVRALNIQRPVDGSVVEQRHEHRLVSSRPTVESIEIDLTQPDLEHLQKKIAASSSDIVIVVDQTVKMDQSTVQNIVDVLSNNDGYGIWVPLLRSLQCGDTVPRDRQTQIVVPVGSGRCMALHRMKVEGIGGFDLAFLPFAVGWDVDLCFRAADQGLMTVATFMPTLKLDTVDHTSAIAPERIAGALRLLDERYSWRRVARAATSLRQCLRSIKAGDAVSMAAAKPLLAEPLVLSGRPCLRKF